MLEFIVNNLSAITQVISVIVFVGGFFIWTARRSDKKFAILEERIFQLAMGKTLKEAMEEKRK